jgi:hypothetical protein
MLGFSPKTAQCSCSTNYTISAREEISLYVIIIEDVFSPVIACKGVLEGDFQQFLRHLLDIFGM